MRCETWQLRAALILGSALFAGALPAAADPIFGPETYERTTGAPDVYSETFSSPAAGSFTLWVQNGDDGGSQVDSASILVNGVEVVKESDFAAGRDLIGRRVALLAGSNSMTLTLAGEPGAFATVMILPRLERPNVTIGRLLVPFASADGLVLDLKNGSHAGARAYRLVFYDGSGAPVASSGRLVLAPRASLSQPVATFVTNGDWSAGSIEVFYAGRGPGRLFGQAGETGALSGVSSIVPMEHAGARFLSPHDQARD